MSGNLERLLAEILAVYRPAGTTKKTAGDSDQIPYTGLSAPPHVGPDDERTVAAVVNLLRQIARAAERSSTLPAPPPSTLFAVLASSELIMRWECLAGRSGELPGLLPGFAYLATVFFLDRQEALRRSDEVKALVKRANYRPR